MSPESLTGHLLIAMPALDDPNFSRTVTFICEHNEDGTLGLVINRPTELTLGEVLAQIGCDTADPEVAIKPVYIGGPVQLERGFVLHRGGSFDTSSVIKDDIAVTVSRDILEAISGGTGPADTLVALGYAGWGAGQLEQEMAENAWLSAPASAKILFGTPFDRRWTAAAELIGVDLALISGHVGHA